MSSGKGLTTGEDICICLATVSGLETLKFLFGWQVASAVGITALIACVAFLYHAGSQGDQP